MRNFVYKPISIAPLIVFRVLFGFIMFVSVVRFMLNGWVDSQYLMPRFFFSYYGFEWIEPPGEPGIYVLFIIMAIAALFVMAGAFYKISASVFFLIFTYVELIDKTNYLNHYYFVSLVSLVMIFLPAHRHFSLDVLRKPSLHVSKIPYWCILIIQLQLALVYFYAGVAKLNYDWLIEALPLRIWLPPNAHIPVVGFLFEKVWVAYFFSWFGAVYDLSIPFFLFYKRTRSYAYIAVIAFHIFTWLLFPIGMFPFIMILATSIFFSPDFHQGLIKKLSVALQRMGIYRAGTPPEYAAPAASKWIMGFFGLFLMVQVMLPWRFALYPGKLFWTEQGYRFSWRVMLMEKAGYVIFHVKDPETGREWEAYAHDYLTPVQEKQMSTQPDMILQYAQFLEQQYIKQGIKDPEIRAEAYVTLNGRGSRLLIDPEVDLTKEQDGFRHKKWILSYWN
ncbi:HTTM domain-containing protein [Fulvivirga ulvae]|uniref:HTTM domain-containing protein n=1 Tax=Fulvivirga ulvae TaxID=2904245 RepID=UPI001F482CA7|nr:HTTM domain-containing protein [Fulvivirga ulvae]UII31768.1 HTTM domain-containing protein [Fulvivirga ulvae]